jgi:anaerobic selenocysteine-containing dehydrogenase
MDLTRRSFLKLCAATAAAGTAPSLLFANDNEPLPRKTSQIGYVRESIVQDLRYGFYHVRYDAMTNNGIQYGIDMMVKDLSEKDIYRKPALEKLFNAMKNDNVDFSKLVKLPNINQSSFS